MRKTVLALATFGALGAACSFAFAGSATIPAPGPNYSPIEKIACGGPGPRCPWGRTWVCGPYGCGCALAAAAIGTAPGGISRLSNTLVSRSNAEGLPIATASASAGAGFRLKAAIR